jgi:AcrR family transcriptional regulator
VVCAAVRLADDEGLAAVTLRAVAGRLGAGTMSLYSYLPDKEALVGAMVEEVLVDLRYPPVRGDWRAELRTLARAQRTVLLHHPWVIDVIAYPAQLGASTLAYLEFGLATLEPTGLDVATRLETLSLITGFVLNLVRAELAAGAAAPPAPDEQQAAQLTALLATGRYPRAAAALAARPADAVRFDLTANFDRLVDRVVDGLVSAAGKGEDRPHD